MKKFRQVMIVTTSNYVLIVGIILYPLYDSREKYVTNFP